MRESRLLAVKAIQLSLEQWLRKNGLNMEEFLSLEDGYEAKASEAVASIKKSAEDLVKMLKAKGKHLFTYDSQGVKGLCKAPRKKK